MNQLQLDKMLELRVIYEDTVSDYVGRGWPEPRRHFHPAHQDGKSLVDVAKTYHDMQCGEYGQAMKTAWEALGKLTDETIDWVVARVKADFKG